MVSDNLRKIIAKNKNEENIYTPIFYRLVAEPAKKALEQLLSENPAISICDTMRSQLRELIKSRTPKRAFTDAQLNDALSTYLDGKDINEYGVWIYYPWRKELVHTLDKEEFIELRTNRNKYKITQDEQDLLAAKTVGVIGLSVGHSIAMTLVNERVCAHIRLADFDTIDLSNLNRIRTGIQNVGINKAVVAAREIAEIDPYVTVELFTTGITDENIDAFFTGGGKKLDLLVEVCDGLNIKIVSRFKAKQLGIPVVMDTNDRGMLDVERFDLEPDRPIMHGLAGDLDPQKIKSLTNEEKIPYILTMIGAETISPRLKASMMEVEQTISTWPQLASSVTLGGALTTDVCRKILLKQNSESGRYYFDFDSMIKSHDLSEADTTQYDGPPELTVEEMTKIADGYKTENQSAAIGQDAVNYITAAASLAPSGGNSQPWKFLYKNNRLFIFHEQHYSYSLLDYNDLGAYIGFGAMFENIDRAAAAAGMILHTDILPLENDKRLMAVINFTNAAKQNVNEHTLPNVLTARVTSRNTGDKQLLTTEDKQTFQKIVQDVKGAGLSIVEEATAIEDLAEVLTAAEKIRFIHPRGHYDTFVKELRFTHEEIAGTCDGLDIDTLNMSEGDKAVLQIAKDPAAINYLHEWDKGQGFKKISRKGIVTASCVCAVTLDGYSKEHFLTGGRLVQQIWLAANERNISFQPVSQIVFLLRRYFDANDDSFNEHEKAEFARLNNELNKILSLEEGRYPVFIFRLFHGDAVKQRALRRPLKKILFSIN